MEKLIKALIEEGAAAAAPFKNLAVAAFPYLPKDVHEGNLSLYARGEDYHIWVKNALERAAKRAGGENWKCYTDVSPFDEVDIAAKAGLGVLGQNRLLITKEYGSYVFIGIVETDLEYEDREYEIKHCLMCGACKRSCPALAIGEKGVDSSVCLSHITQKRGELNEKETELIKNHPLIWGCDICQLVCPMNRDVKRAEKDEIIWQLKNEDTEISDRQFRKEYGGFAFSFRGVAPLKRNNRIKGEKQEKISP